MIQLQHYDKSHIAVGESIDHLLTYIPKKHHHAFAIITDVNVSTFHKNKFPDAPVITIGLTEKNKTQKTVDHVMDELLKGGADRHWFLVGIGGGMVCDVTGYVASIYMRGIPFGYVPTTLLAQADASIGGKTGINFRGYKNMIGVFSQPKFVICDTDLLKTLPIGELKNGLIEIIKHGLIADPSLFEFIKSNREKIIRCDKEALSHSILSSVHIKTKIVSADELEKGERKKLNLGHSYGHAIESLTGISHGKAVAIGLVYAATLSVKLGYCSKAVLSRIIALLHTLEMDTSCELADEKIIQHMLKDKKRKRNSIDFVVIEDIGKVTVKSIDFEVLKKVSN